MGIFNVKDTLGRLWGTIKGLSEIIIHGIHFTLINIHGCINIVIHVIKPQTIDERLNDLLQRLNGNNTYLQHVAIVELLNMARKKELDKKIRELLCESLCHYLSSHSDCRMVINALFGKDSPFASMQKIIKGVDFVEQKLSGAYIVENVKFDECNFFRCCFHNTHFRNCSIIGGIISGCDYKDDIKLYNCHIKDVQMDNLYFRHTDFHSITIQGGKLSSSTFLRSELRDFTFLDIDMGDIIFEICKFQREGFTQCQMNNVKFKYKNSEERHLRNMQEALIHQGYQPCAELSSMTLVVG
ncbi:MAG: pentapeptide repeat-containing protein [Bacteroidaceae bacterium]|nr:pentapeptide repeat-containing protein [Bacteroidaceae bacterium]